MHYFLLIFLLPSLCNSYGVISIDTKSKSSAYAVNFTFEQKALNKIKSECPNCNKIYLFKNSCAAISKGYGGYGFSIQKTEKEAKEKSIYECQKYATYCYVVTWGCDYE